MATIKQIKNEISNLLQITESELNKNEHFKNAKFCLSLQSKKKLTKDDLISILDFFKEGLYGCNMDGSFIYLESNNNNDGSETTVDNKSEVVNKTTDETTVDVKSEVVSKDIDSENSNETTDKTTDETTTKKEIAIEKYQNLGLVVGNEANPVVTFSLWQNSDMTKSHKDTAVNVVITGKASKDKSRTLIYTISANAKNKQYQLYELSFDSNFKLSFTGLKDCNTPIPYPFISLHNEIQNAQTFGHLGLIALGEINNLSPIVELNSRNIQITNTLVILLGRLLNQSGDKLEINESYEKSFNAFSDLEKVNLVIDCANYLKSYLGKKYLDKTIIGALSHNLSKQLEQSKASNN